MAKDPNVRFIRVRGRVVPIRNKKGQQPAIKKKKVQYKKKPEKMQGLGVKVAAFGAGLFGLGKGMERYQTKFGKKFAKIRHSKQLSPQARQTSRELVTASAKAIRVSRKVTKFGLAIAGAGIGIAAMQEYWRKKRGK